ncbi:MAG TPA: hypothetical protein VHU13_02455 [Solirubrobacteraceae bacterium]|jgi:hypothetical protein|nr:hypothetical protein [Solirubrobacteraceae bacterium]
MHQRVRCATCHHWTDALLVWAAGDCCPRCNAPMQLGEADERDSGSPAEPPQDQTAIGWRSGERGRRPPNRLGASSRFGERQAR